MQTAFLNLFFREGCLDLWVGSLWKLGNLVSFINSASPRSCHFLLWMSQFLELYYRSKNNHLLHSGVTQTLYMIFSIIISTHYQVYVLVQVVYTSSTKAAAQAWQNKICMMHSVLQSLIPGQDYPYALQTHKLKTGYTEGSQHQQQALHSSQPDLLSYPSQWSSNKHQNPSLLLLFVDNTKLGRLWKDRSGINGDTGRDCISSMTH